jgi:hypothetical protein
LSPGGSIAATLFQVDVRTISEHLSNIFESEELVKASTIRNFRIVQNEGGRDIQIAFCQSAKPPEKQMKIFEEKQEKDLTE